MAAVRIVRRPSSWQRVLHGEAQTLRETVCDVLASEKTGALALRYALCGLGDHVMKGADGASIKPRGCGHKLCPRCGRRRGGKYARRIIGWLGHEAHGDLWSVVLTQRVQKGEGLKECRERMAAKQRRYMRWLTRRGMVAAMTTVHLVWSVGSDGWHYHVHVMAEMPGGAESIDSLLDGWQSAAAGEFVRTGGQQCRLVAAAGDAIAELRQDDGDVEFWSESSSSVGRAVQYPLRDVVQGVSAWRLGGDMERAAQCARELVRCTGGWKMFRAWGRWRLACPAVKALKEAEREKAKAADDEGSVAAPAVAATPVGTVGRLWRAAVRGEAEAREVFRSLELRCKNNSSFGVRFVAFCRAAWCVPDGG